ncbi:uncharacterized protein [Leuresthes tenuis]|uniref:uncharacterized protein n=1 Tax=Leuresthes tenuis TaxID=355514 RepID=UPI003B50BD8B
MRTGSPAQSAAPPQPEALTQAPAQQSNPHVTPSSSPHLLTPNQDPDICLPTAIREEIRLTPQIQGPPLPPPPLAQAEPLPQGKPSRPGPPCFTRPLSQATVMEGSPVTLEVEVMGHPEPRLTWLKDGEVSASTTCLAPSRDQRKSFLFPPEAADPEGGLSDASRHDPQPAAANSSSGDRWLVAEVCDIISVDFHSWFGTLCVLLWLLYLLLL